MPCCSLWVVNWGQVSLGWTIPGYHTGLEAQANSFDAPNHFPKLLQVDEKSNWGSLFQFIGTSWPSCTAWWIFPKRQKNWLPSFIENLKQYLVFLVMSNYNVINTINVIKNLVLFHFCSRTVTFSFFRTLHVYHSVPNKIRVCQKWNWKMTKSKSSRSLKRKIT